MIYDKVFVIKFFVVLKISIEILNKRTYEKVTFYHLPNGILVCDNNKRQETQSRRECKLNCVKLQ